MAAKVDAILRGDGHRTVLQQFDFANRNFMERMDTALASGARVVAILSPEYQATDYCTVEWMHALAGDPLNKKGRLIVLRAAETEPRGLLPRRSCDARKACPARVRSGAPHRSGAITSERPSALSCGSLRGRACVRCS